MPQHEQNQANNEALLKMFEKSKDAVSENDMLNSENQKNQPDSVGSLEKLKAVMANNNANGKSFDGAMMEKSEGLTYDEAIAKLKDGCSVTLPEWKGIWFPIRDKIYVFTKDGELLDTPQHDVYGTRNDWSLHVNDGTGWLPRSFVKAVRRRADTILSHIKALSGNRELSLAATSCQLGFMWLGLYLAELGADNPYPHSSDPTSPVIEKHADKAEDDFLTHLNSLIETHTAIVKTLRAELQNIVYLIEFIHQWNPSVKHQPHFVAIDKFVEAKLWLGQELNNIRMHEEHIAHQQKLSDERQVTRAMEAYNRYGSVTDFKNFQGNPMPNFESLSDQIKEAWKAAANEPVSMLKGSCMPEALAPGRGY